MPTNYQLRHHLSWLMENGINSVTVTVRYEGPLDIFRENLAKKTFTFPYGPKEWLREYFSICCGVVSFGLSCFCLETLSKHRKQLLKNELLPPLLAQAEQEVDRRAGINTTTSAGASAASHEQEVEIDPAALQALLQQLHAAGATEFKFDPSTSSDINNALARGLFQQYGSTGTRPTAAAQSEGDSLRTTLLSNQ